MTNAARKLPDDETDQRTFVQEATLDCRLKSWAREYGGGKYEDIGFAGKNMLVTMAEHAGEPPGGGGYRRTIIGTMADEIEDAVQLMLKEKDTWRAAHAIRTEYFRPELPEEEKLKALRRSGCGMSRAGYYVALAAAKISIRAYLAGRMMSWAPRKSV